MLVKIWRWLVAKWWLIYTIVTGVMVVIAIIIQLVLPQPNYQDSEINYQRFRHLNAIAEYFEALLIIPAIMLLFVILLYMVKSRNFWRIAGLTGITLVIFVLWLAVIGTLIAVRFWSYDLTRMVHIDTVAINDDIYNLTSVDNPMYPGTLWGYAIYKCDNSESRCQKLHIEYIYALAYRDLNPELQANGSQVEFYLNDELPYTTAR